MVRAIVQLAQSLGITPAGRGHRDRGAVAVPGGQRLSVGQGFLFAGRCRPRTSPPGATPATCRPGRKPRTADRPSQARILDCRYRRQLARTPGASRSGMRITSPSSEELAPSADGARFVVCALAGQEYAIPADNVVEVFRFAAVMPLPDSPPWVLGVIDVRGRVVPVVDGRRRLGLPERDHWLRAVIVLIEHETVSGFVVDEARDMVRHRDRGHRAGRRRRRGRSPSGRVGERMLLIIDPSLADPRSR